MFETAAPAQTARHALRATRCAPRAARRALRAALVSFPSMRSLDHRRADAAAAHSALWWGWRGSAAHDLAQGRWTWPTPSPLSAASSTAAMLAAAAASAAETRGGGDGPGPGEYVPAGSKAKRKRGAHDVNMRLGFKRYHGIINT